MTTDPLAMVGTGYVGLVTAVGLARLGHEVYCVETDPGRLASLQQSRVPFYEPGLQEALEEHREQLHFSDGYADAVGACRLFFVAVGTPTSETGQADLSAVWSVMDSIPLHDGQAVVMKSTVPPGTGAACRRRLDQRGLTGVAYVSCPEFLRESTGLHDFANPDKVVIGAEDGWAVEAVAEVYRPLIEPSAIIRTDATTAETLKLAGNAFLTARISYINEIANLCDAVGADVSAVARGIGLDPRVGPMFLQAGIGFGGSCFGKDLKSLAHECRHAGVRSDITDAILAVNDHQWERVLDKLESDLGELEGRTVALLGLAFKPGTSNVRDATSLLLLPGLHSAGVRVRAHDPQATLEAIARTGAVDADVLDATEFCDAVLDAVLGADAVVLVTEWPEFLASDWSAIGAAMDGTLVIDGRNVLDASAITAAGLRYEGIGRRGSATVER